MQKGWLPIAPMRSEPRKKMDFIHCTNRTLNFNPGEEGELHHSSSKDCTNEQMFRWFCSLA